MDNLSPLLLIVGLFFLVIILPGTLYFFRSNYRGVGRYQLKRLKEDEDFDVAQLITGLNNSFLVAIDYDLAKVAYIEDDYYILLSFDDIVAAQVLTQSETTNLSPVSMIEEPAVVGKNILSQPSVPIDAFTKEGSKYSPGVLLHLTLNLRNLPDLYINCFDSKKHKVDANLMEDKSYLQALDLAEKLEVIFKYIGTINSEQSALENAK